MRLQRYDDNDPTQESNPAAIILIIALGAIASLGYMLFFAVSHENALLCLPDGTHVISCDMEGKIWMSHLTNQGYSFLKFSLDIWFG